MKDIKTIDIQKNGRPCIYKIQNKINNKVYIGSAIGHYKRKGQHFYLLRNNKHFNTHLQSSWNKYGEENFIFKVLEFIENLETLKKREEYYIKMYSSNNPEIGFNYRIYCNTNLGIKRSLESRLKQSRSKVGITPNLDYEAIAKLNSKIIKGTNKITNKMITFDSVKQAGEILKIQKTSISKVLHNKLKSAGGYYWDFVEKSTSNNPVNSGEVLRDNPDPNSSNSIEVDEKEQRLTGEELTNKPDTSAGHPWISFKEFNSLKKWMMR
jgi:hypothetical protein